MVKYGILSDTHIEANEDPEKIRILLEQLRRPFKDVNEIIHAGDVCEKFFLEELENIAPTMCVKGDFDNFSGLEEFVIISTENYKIGVIHTKPENLEAFFKKKSIQILIFGHTHQPIIKGTPYNTLLINPGSPTKPKAPPQKKGFDKPFARRSVITMNIDKDGVLSTYLINLKF